MSSEVEQVRERPASSHEAVCDHCGDRCGRNVVSNGNRHFCCAGCLTVYSLLQQSGLDPYYTLGDAPGVRPSEGAVAERFAYLDKRSIRDRLLDYEDQNTGRVTLTLPQIHCSSCIYLLENLFRLDAGVRSSRVDFQKRSVAILFDAQRLPLSRLVALLTSLGYEPEIKLSDLDSDRSDRSFRSLYARLAVAGFCFGNIMLLSLPHYLGFESVRELVTGSAFDWLKLGLALPVLLFGASGFFRSAGLSLRQRRLNMDVPISLGISVLFLRSVYDIMVLNGPGYLDSMAALVFLLLLGRLYQRKTYSAIQFNRDYRSYLPIAVVLKSGLDETSVPLDEVGVGDHILVRSGEVIPVDAIVVEGKANIDYSFVTGESTPVRVTPGARVFAGGRQVGVTVELEVAKEPSRSYLFQLWEEAEAAVEQQSRTTSLANRVSEYFTPAILGIAATAAGYWWLVNPSLAWTAATSVLIVACPCALALASPFALGTAQRLLGRGKVFLKSSDVVERLAGVTTIVFDKTGTITDPAAGAPEFVGPALSDHELAMIRSVVRLSIHPLSVRLRDALGTGPVLRVTEFVEKLGHGLRGCVDGHSLSIGSAQSVGVGACEGDTSSRVYVAIDERVKGYYRIAGRYRAGLSEVVRRLSERYRLSLLSGDHDGERSHLESVFGGSSELLFEQSPQDKLRYVTRLVEAGDRVAMIGDGLNDAGALRAAGVGLAVVEQASSFSPASDGVIEAGAFELLPRALQFSRDVVKIIKLSFALSILYNGIGLGFAVSGSLSPVVAALLMPASSVTVVLFATVTAGYCAGRRGLTKR